MANLICMITFGVENIFPHALCMLVLWRVCSLRIHTHPAHHANYTQRCFVCVCDARVCVSGMNSFVLINTHTHPAAELLLCGCNKGKRDQIAGRASIFSPALCVIISMANNIRAKDFSLYSIQLYLVHIDQVNYTCIVK
jgi:hypothetical protein